MSHFQSWGPLCALCSSFTWALGTSVYSRLSKEYSAFSINFYRAAIGLPLFILTAFLLSGSWAAGVARFQEADGTHWIWLALSSIASYGLGDVLFLWGSQRLGISTTLAIASCAPIWAVLAGVVFLGHTLTLYQVLGLAVIVLGVMVVILNGPAAARAQLTEQPFSGSGFILALGASFLWALNSFSVAQGGAQLLPSVGNAIRMSMVLILCPLFARCFSSKADFFLPKSILVQYGWVFLIEGFLGATFLVYGLSHSPLALGATLSSLAPVISVPIAVFLRIEKFSIPKTLGVCMVVFGISLLMEGG